MHLDHIIQRRWKQPHVFYVCLVDKFGCESLVLVAVPGQFVLIDALTWLGSNVSGLGGPAARVDEYCQCHPLALADCIRQKLITAVLLQLIQVVGCHLYALLPLADFLNKVDSVVRFHKTISEDDHLFTYTVVG